MRAQFGVAGLIGANLVLTFVQQLWVTVQLGPGRETDAFFAGLTVPQVMTTIAAGLLTNVLVPLLTVESVDGRRRLGWTIAHGATAVLLVLGLTLAATATFWIRATLPGLDAAGVALAVELARIHLLSMVAGCVASILAAVYRAGGDFVWVEGSTAVGTVAGLLVLVLTLPRYGIHAAAWSLVLRATLPIILMLRGLGAYRSPDWRQPAAREFRRRAVVLVSASTITKSDLLVDRFLASLAPPGSLTLLTLAQTICSSAHLVLNRALVLPALPQLAHAASLRDGTELGRVVRRLAVLLGAAGLAVLGLIAIAGMPVLEATLLRGTFRAEDARLLWQLLLLLGGVLVAGGAGYVLSSAFYALGDVRTVSRIALIGFAVAVAMKAGGYHMAGVYGIAAAASVYYVMNTYWLYAVLRRNEFGRSAVTPAVATTTGS